MAVAMRWLVGVTWLGLVWALVLQVTGGFVLSIGPLHLSSRGPRNPLLLALVSLVLTWVIAPSRRRRSAFAAAWQDASRPLLHVLARVGSRTPTLAARVVVASVALAIVVIGLVQGAHVAGGSDSYGYVSQAHLWATGSLRVTDTGATVLPAGISSGALIPYGYRLTDDGSALVPIYAPGLPMQMALFERFGGRDWVFLVMPLLAGVAVWATYALGRHAGGNGVGVFAALLFAASPTVLFQLTHAPMSDLPAAAWWGAALATLFRPSRRAALLCGLASGVAILTRPNLVPLAAIPGSLLLWDALRSRKEPRAWHRLALFAGGSIPACGAIAALNTYWYGSPLRSGYGELAGSFFRIDHAWPNLTQYAGWAVESQGPALVVAALAPALLFWRHDRRETEPSNARRAIVVCGVFVLTTWLSYLFYLPFDTWWALRLLLPAFPALFVLMSVSLLRLTERVPPVARPLATAALVAVAILWSTTYARTSRALDSSDEQRFATIGRYLAEHAPRQSVVLAKHHSGSARHYSGRLTFRFDEVPPSQLDGVVDTLRQRGYATFIALDDWEEREFRMRFAGASRLGALDWAPEATTPGAVLYAAASQR
jgi:hypothetical protein